MDPLRGGSNLRKHPFLRGLPWRFLKFQIHWSLAVPNSTPTPPPWPEITFLVSFSPTGYSLTFGQPALAIGQTTYQADTWPWGNPWNPSPTPQEDMGKSYASIPKNDTREGVNKQIWVNYSLTNCSTSIGKGCPKFWTTFSIVLSVAKVAERNPFASILSRTLLLQIFRSVFPPQPTPQKWINKKNHSKSKPETSPPSRNKKVPAQKNTPGLARRVDFFHSAPPGWHRVAHRTSRTSPPIAMRQEKGPQKHVVCGVDFRIVFWVGGWVGGVFFSCKRM